MSRALPSQSGRNEQVISRAEIATNGCKQSAGKPHIAAIACAHFVFHAQLWRTQIEISRTIEIRKRHRRQGRGIVRSKDHLVLTEFQGCLAILQTDISVEQTRQGKHLRSLKSGDAAEEIHGGKPSRGKTSDLRTVEN